MSQTNPTIQKLMDEAQAIKPDDPEMMNKLQEIAQKIAEAQGKVNKPVTATGGPVDPMDELGCEGCQ
jgi:hypothetical protein